MKREQEIKLILNKGRYGFTNDEDCISWALSTIPELLDRVEELEKVLKEIHLLYNGTPIDLDYLYDIVYNALKESEEIK